MKIDVNRIDGYADMTAEEKVAALEGFDLPGESQDVAKLKNALNKASSEAAKYKHDLQEKMTEDERKEAERKEQQEKAEQELNSLRREKAISGHYNELIAMGYDPELAKATAEAMMDGKYTDVYANQKKFLEAQRQAIREEALKQQPGLSNGKPLTPQQIDAEQNEKLRNAMFGY